MERFQLVVLFILKHIADEMHLYEYIKRKYKSLTQT